MLTPYLLYIKIGLIALVVAAITGTGLYIRHVFNERAALRLSEASLKAQVTTYQESAIANQKLQEGITNAIKNIRVQSNTYVQKIDSSPVPALDNGTAVTLVAGGVYTTPSLPFVNRSTAHRRAVPAPY